MKFLLRLRSWLIGGLRWALAALACSSAGRGLLRGWLTVLGSQAVLELHDEALSWLTGKKLVGNRERLARRLRRGARSLRFNPGILRRNDSEAVADTTLTLVLLWGLRAGALATIVDELLTAESHSVPIFVTDCDDFDAFRKHGCLFEYIPEREEWIRHHGSDGWLPYLSRRLDGILETWDPDRVLLLDDAQGQTLRHDGVWSALAGQSPAAPESNA